MPDERLKMLGIGMDDDEREGLEKDFYILQNKMDKKELVSKSRVAAFERWSVSLRESFTAWAEVFKADWGAVIVFAVGSLMLLIVTWAVMSLMFSSFIWGIQTVGGVFTPWVTG